MREEETGVAEDSSPPNSRPSYWDTKRARATTGRSSEAGAGDNGVARRTLSIAVAVMTVLVIGLVTWLFMHRKNSPPAASSQSSAVTITQGPSDGTGDASSSRSSSSQGFDSQSGASDSQHSESTSFPAGVVNKCKNYSAANKYSEDAPSAVVADDGIRFAPSHATNSCTFVVDAAKQIRSEMQRPNAPAEFSLSVYSDYRAHQDATQDPYVPLSCTRSKGMAHCVSAKGRRLVDMYVR